MVCITGASGAIYGIRLMQALASGGQEVHAIVSPWGEKVLAHETGRTFSSWMEELRLPKKNVHSADDMAALPASGSFRLDGAIIAPCSTSSLGAIAAGISASLIHRAAQTALKEKWPLILVPRETPLSLVALRNMASLAEAGADILPASPGFYHLPKTMDDMIDFVVGKILDRLSISHTIDTLWRGLK